MRNIIKSPHLSGLKKIALITAIFGSFASTNNALATIIDFDDLNPVFDLENACWCDNPLYDQYIDKDLLIFGAWVVGENSQNQMLTSNWATLEFVGELPTFISMNITSVNGDAVLLDVYGASGLLYSKVTSGWQGLEEYSTPAIPDELITFNSDIGISHIDIQGFYNMRIGASVDNLNFTSTKVTEPTPFALLSLGLLGLLLLRYKSHIKNK